MPALLLAALTALALARCDPAPTEKALESNTPSTTATVVVEGGTPDLDPTTSPPESTAVRPATEGTSVPTKDEELIAFINVNVIPMTFEGILTRQTVLVQGSRIAAVGPSAEIPVPEHASVIDGEGAFLAPGLADMHVHTRDDWLSQAWPVSPLDLYLANGVTTIRDFGPVGEDLSYTRRWKQSIEDGEMRGPTLYGTGRILYGPVEDPWAAVQEQKELGFDFIKLYSYLSLEEFEEAITAAKELGMYTAGHIPFAVGLERVLSSGMDEIAHVEELDYEFIDFDRDGELGQYTWLPYIIGAAYEQTDVAGGFDAEEFRRGWGEALDSVVRGLRGSNTPVCTTLVVGEVIGMKLFEPDKFLSRPENRYLPESYLYSFKAGREKHQQQFKGVEDLASYKYGLERLLLSELHRAGVRLLLSTDSGTGGMGIVPGFSIHDELRILTENGFTPYEAIAAGTIHAAAVVEEMVGEGGFGAVAVGNRADLILVSANPLEDVAHLKGIQGVMAAGRWFSRATLDSLIAVED
jgi:cytosine/adenosine deaminase-related metal-dependent hydrolase